MKKKLILLSSFVLVAFAAFSQSKYGQVLNADSYVKFPRNEIRVNLLTSVLGLPEINYEHFVEDNFGVGFALQVSAENYQDMTLRAGFIPYGRLYFGNQLNAGFFIEGSFGVVAEKFDRYDFNTSTGDPKITVINEINMGVGVSVGYKFLTKNNWVGDVSIGAGRIFGNTIFEAYPRAGISIGKRF